MSRKNAELLLAGVIVARSMSLLFAKKALDTLDPFNLLAARFCLAFLVLAVLFLLIKAKTASKPLKKML